MVAYYKQTKAVSDTFEKKTKYFRDVLIAKAFNHLSKWTSDEIIEYIERNGCLSTTEEENLRNAKILIIKQYDEMDYQTLLKAYNYGRICKIGV